MEKAYELKALVDELKGRGLDIAEDSALIVFDCFMEWFRKSAIMSANTYDDLALLILPKVDEFVKSQLIDKIDGKDEI